MAPAAVLAREAIQNSADAQLNGQKVKVAFRKVELRGHEKKAFVEALALAQELPARKELLGFQLNHCVDHLDDLDRPLSLLYVDDFNTCGLSGDPHSSSSHFFRLLLSLGDGSKSRGKAGSGGSYGYGKSVYSSNSRIHTLVAYSVFKPEGNNSENFARLMGCGYFSAHQFNGDEFTGRAWFGVPSANSNAVIDPFNDADAQRLAKNLGFQVREPGTTGTSMLIVDCDVDINELRASVEEWWWPRILDEQSGLDVVLYENGKLVPPPRPRSRKDIFPFKRCFDLALRVAIPTGKDEKADETEEDPQC